MARAFLSTALIPSESLASGAATRGEEYLPGGVFLGYASRKGATLLDRRLYLPESCLGDSRHQDKAFYAES
jgi:hypothetical protein